MVSRSLLSVLLLLTWSAPAVAVRAASHNEVGISANPIRKVVTMLQAMQKKVAEEGDREKGLYDKFMCYCKTNGGSLTESISAAEKKVPAVSSDISASESQKINLEEDLKQAQADRSAAKAAQVEATAIREKEAAEFAAEKAEYTANIGAVNSAVAALSKGMAGGFLQTNAAQVLRQIAVGKQDILDADRQQLLAFLSGSQRYVPQSGEITGILKEIGDNMEKSLAEATTTEDTALKSHGELMAAKGKEVAALSESIESKMNRVGELAVSIVQMKNDLTDTQEALMQDKQFLAEMETGCKTKTSEWEERVKTRSEELAALAQTIKLLNDDDALELFKTTLPSPGAASLVQVNANNAQLRARALNAIRQGKTHVDSDKSLFDLLELAMRGKKVSFDKVIKMIDDMATQLKKEQQDDVHKKEYCNTQLDSADDKRKNMERAVADKEAAIATATEGIDSLKVDITNLEAGIKALDKTVAEATEQRKEEHSGFSELMASNSAAKQLLGLAKNRLNKFYQPKLYVPPAKRELTTSERISENMGMSLLELSSHQLQTSALPPPPETFSTYSKKSEESNGVVAMVNLLIADLDKEMTEAETEEKDSQADYEAAMKDSAAKRSADSKLLTEKKSSHANLEAALEDHKSDKDSGSKELMATMGYIHSLHTECDWLLKYFDVRKEARASEVESLSNAKAVLSGSDFSFVQARTRSFLGRTN